MLKQRLKPKHLNFAKNLVKHNGNQKDAYLDTYPKCSASVASACSSKLISSKPAILDYAREIANRNGVTIESLTKKVRQKMEAQKLQGFPNGVIETVDDNPTQMKATELGLKIHGVLAPETDNSVNTINIQNNQALILDKFDARLDKVLELFEKKTPIVKNETVSKSPNESQPVNDTIVSAEFETND